MLKIYKIKPEAFATVTKVLEDPVNDAFRRNGYIMRESRSLGLEEKGYYLQVSGPDEFFKAHEKEIMLPGVEITKGKEFEDAKRKIEEEESSAAAGMGAIFGEL